MNKLQNEPKMLRDLGLKDIVRRMIDAGHLKITREKAEEIWARQDAEKEKALNENCKVCGLEFNRHDMKWTASGFGPFCSDTCARGYENERRKGEVAKNHQDVMRRLNIPKEFWNKTFDNFKIFSSDMASHLNKIHNWYAEKDTAFLFIHGETGCGKTHLAVAALKEFYKLKATGFFNRIEDLAKSLREVYSQEKKSEFPIIEKHCRARFLVLDDLGADKQSDFIVTRIYDIVNYRNSENLLTIFTSNYGIEIIEDAYGSRIASRIKAGLILHLAAPDYRNRRKEKNENQKREPWA